MFKRKITEFIVISLLITAIVLGAIVYTLFASGAAVPSDTIPQEKTRIVILDAGHGGEDCGAIGKNGVYEKDLNLQIAKTLGEYLTKSGYTVVYTRTEDKLLYTDEENIKGFRKIYDLKNRVKISEQYKDALFVSLHMNSFGEEKSSGLQVYFSKNVALSQKLASNIQNEVRERVQPNNTRGIKATEDLYVLTNNPNAAVLIECGFLSNGNECQKLCEKEYQKELCFAIVCGIISANE